MKILDIYSVWVLSTEKGWVNDGEDGDNLDFYRGDKFHSPEEAQKVAEELNKTNPNFCQVEEMTQIQYEDDEENIKYVYIPYGEWSVEEAWDFLQQ